MQNVVILGIAFVRTGIAILGIAFVRILSCSFIVFFEIFDDMILNIPTEKYIKKYLIAKGHEVINIRKSNFFGMLLLAHLKYRDNQLRKSSRNRYFKLDDTIEADLSSTTFIRQRMKTIEVTEVKALSFAQNMRDIFFNDFFQYMNLRLCVKDCVSSNEKIVTMVDDYLRMMNMTEDDISSETLVRVYRRHRANNTEELETLLDLIANE